MTLDATNPSQEAQTSYQPALRDMVMLELPLDAKVSPAGDCVAIRVRTTNWKEDRYERAATFTILRLAHPIHSTGRAM